MNRPYRIGTRKSPLALKQTDIVVKALQQACPGDVWMQNPEIVEITTTGDLVQDKSLADIGGKALFVKEIEQALLENRIDFGVHSLKDVEANLNPNFKIGCVLTREVPNDVLILKNVDNASLQALRQGAVVGTCSPRRAAQLQRARPDLKIVPLRGNVLTRLTKLESEGLDAIVLALAGLKRLGLWHEASLVGHPSLKACVLTLDQMLPAVGQGVLAVEVLANDDKTLQLLQNINDKKTEVCMKAERALLKELGGDCKTPIAAFCSFVTGTAILLRAFYVSPESGQPFFYEEIGSAFDPEDLGIRVGKELQKT